MHSYKRQPLYLLLSPVPMLLAFLAQFLLFFTLLFLKQLFPSPVFSFLMTDALWLTALSNLFLFLFFYIWYRYGFSSDSAAGQGRTVKSIPYLLLLGIGLFLVSNGVMFLEEVLLPDQMNDYIKLIEDAGLNSISLISSFTTLLAAPVTEELIFRGVTLKLLQKSRFPFWLVNLIQSVLFGIYHGNWIQGIYAALLGFVLGYVCELCHSLPASILLHCMFNFFGTYVVAALNLLPIHPVFYYLLSIPGAAITVLSLRLLKKKLSAASEPAGTCRTN